VQSFIVGLILEMSGAGASVTNGVYSTRTLFFALVLRLSGTGFGWEGNACTPVGLALAGRASVAALQI
jgi:hypothetical protein